MVEPSPRSMNSGLPPTDRKARTGLLTPPGSLPTARSMSRAERSIVNKVLAFRLSPLPCITLEPPCKRLTEVYYPRPVPTVTELTPKGEHYRCWKPARRGLSGGRPTDQEPYSAMPHPAAAWSSGGATRRTRTSVCRRLRKRTGPAHHGRAGPACAARLDGPWPCGVKRWGGSPASPGLSGQPAGDVRGEVRDNNVGAGALDAREGLQDRALFVEPAVLGCGFDHGVLAAHAVGRNGKVRRLAHPAHHVEVGQRRLHHNDVRALADVELDLRQRLAGVRRVHLVGAAVAELGGAVCGLAERAVEGGGVLGGVGHDRGVLETLVVELGPNGGDPAVHHVRRGDDVGARLGVGGGGARDQLEAHVV